MMQGQEEPPSVAQLRRLFYPSQADKHEEGKGRVTPLLPFSDEGQAERWAQADLESQLLLAQVVRQAILPWYARITQDRDFIVETVIALRSALQVAFRAASTSSGTSSSVLSLFVSEELPALLIQHYREYRRASDVYPSFGSLAGGPTASQVYLASNPHPALSVSRHGRLHVSEAYIDSLLQSLLEALLPLEQSSSEAQVAILRDVIKGSITNQLRIRGRGTWVLVRAIGQLMGRDLSISSSLSSQASLSPASPASPVSPASQEHTVDVGSIATSLLHGLYALASMLMPLVVRSYLDLFTPNAELRRSSEAPARGSRLRQKRAAANGSNSGRSTSSKSSVVSILPTVHLAVEALELPKRALGSFFVWICQLSALWHLDQSIARASC
ncbi:hypothetical protein FA10DRAFT_48640 [Acaromyces ingoldii]|uniref:PXA domain-containing protein n=1 Tax=Acaromyces ingoldii TaxID=215250 RepID=A0A316YY89_9BASI|nr:hypothetical protein FA10DRAFT_48640 [Acaromyces ingoldii]PWN94417.1 hypothetical protein FA10DRAFT_48640 [Acaromyces ingoldii]